MNAPEPWRPSLAPSDPSVWSQDSWERPDKLPAWTDWLGLLPPLTITLAFGGFAARSLATQEAPVVAGDIAGAVGSVLLVALLLFALVGAALSSARRECVRLALHPAGVVLVLRGGRERQARREEIASVFLRTGDISGMDVGTVGVTLHTGEHLSLREPLTAPLPHVAEHLARHLGVPVTRG